MPYQLFSATGCMRCKIVKSFLDENNISYEELNIKADGKDAFKLWYKENRPDVFRGKEGVEFPILYTGEKIFQGVGIILSFLMAGDRLDKFITQSDLSHGWISGINLSAGNIEAGSPEENNFLSIIEFLSSQGLLIQLETDGRNASLLATLVNKKMIHSLIFYLRGPADLYNPLTGLPLDEEELIKSLCVLKVSENYKIILPVTAFIRENGEAGYILPEEAAAAAKLVERATANKKHPFFIEPVNPLPELNIAPLASAALFKYRTQCRRHMVLSEIIK